MIHAMRPKDPRFGREFHALVWVHSRPRERRGGETTSRHVMQEIRVTRMLRRHESVGLCGTDAYTGVDAFSDWVCNRPRAVGTLTLWLARGWRDAVLCGITDAIDRGQYVRRWIGLDGDRLALKGLWCGRVVRVTSLGAWTGGAWDGWGEALALDPEVSRDIPPSRIEDEGERTAVRTVWAILSGLNVWSAGSTRLTMSAQARSWWACGIGPICEVGREREGGGTRPRSAKAGAYVAPLPWRSHAARHAERQASYGLGTEQYQIGPMEGPISVIDMTGSYLSCLLHTPLPTAYDRELLRPSPDALAAALEDGTASALVLIDSPDRPYPVRRVGRSRRAVGTFWTWLAGIELRCALREQRVIMCEAAHLWTTIEPDQTKIRAVQAILRELTAHHLIGHKHVLRGLYSTLIGGFAAWGREWARVADPAPFGRWGSWNAVDEDTGEITRYRAIAGQVERLVLRDDAGSAVAQVYADVLARARQYIYDVCAVVGWQHVVQLAADAIWLTASGMDRWQALASGGCPDAGAFRPGAVYDRIWIDGEGRTVAEADGRRYVHVPGIPHEIALGNDGTCQWVIGTPWDRELNPSHEAGVPEMRRRYDAAAIVTAAGDRQRPGEPWLRLSELALPDSLIFCRNSDKKRRK